MDFQSPNSSPSKESNGSLGSLNIDSDRNSPLFKHREEEAEVSANATKLQLRALVYKNFSLQAKQKGTNICQVTLYFWNMIDSISSNRSSLQLFA